jgi:DUF4097 and DUF4098 domain-containing protein YvlB
MRVTLHLPRTSRLTATFSMAALLALSVACNLQIGTGIEAKDTWTRSYTVKSGATLSVRENSGTIRVEATDGDKIEVTATLISTAPTEEAAKADLKEFTIAEHATADLVELDSSTRTAQFVLHQSRRVDYQIKVPKSLNVAIRTVNGTVDVHGVGGDLTVDATNGKVDADGLGGGANVSAVNGRVTLEFVKIADAGVRCKTTNGEIVITIPSAAKATIAARVLHGEIQTQNLSLQTTEESRQRLNANMGGGGPELRLEATNGEIRVIGR